MNLACTQGEIEDAVDYARNYLRIESNSYQKVWYRLHTATDVEKWENVLALSELVFRLNLPKHIIREWESGRVVSHEYNYLVSNQIRAS